MIRLVNAAGAKLTLPTTISFRRVPLSIGVPIVNNSGGDGAVVVGRSRLEARRFSLSGSIYYPDKQQIRDEADKLLQFLQRRPIEVFKWSDSERRLYSYPQGLPQDWVDAGAELQIDIPMLAPDPLWYGDEVTHEEAEASTWNVDLDGTAPALPVVKFTVTETGNGLQLTNTNTGQTIELDGSYQAGDVVTVDTATFDAARTRGAETEPIIDRMSDWFVASGFELQPGLNTLQYTGPRTDISMTFRPRWY